MSVFQLLASLICFLILFFGNYVFYGIISAEFFEFHSGGADQVKKEKVEMAFIALGFAAQAIVMTLLFSKWSGKKYHVIKGLIFGVLIGFFLGFGTGLVSYGTTNLLDLRGADGRWVLAYPHLRSQRIGHCFGVEQNKSHG